MAHGVHYRDSNHDTLAPPLRLSRKTAAFWARGPQAQASAGRVWLRPGPGSESFKIPLKRNSKKFYIWCHFESTLRQTKCSRTSTTWPFWAELTPTFTLVIKYGALIWCFRFAAFLMKEYSVQGATYITDSWVTIHVVNNFDYPRDSSSGVVCISPGQATPLRPRDRSIQWADTRCWSDAVKRGPMTVGRQALEACSLPTT